MSPDILEEQLGPVTAPRELLTPPVDSSEELRISIWLPGEVFDSGKHPDGTDLVEVEDFVIETEADLSPSLAQPRLAGGSDPFRPSPEAAAVLDSLSKTASVIARNFLAGIRLHLRQYWVAPTGTPSPVESRLWDADTWDAIAARAGSTGRPIPFTMLASTPGGASVLSRPALDPELGDILSGAAAGNTGLPERLLSSAFGKLWSAYPDPQTAVFLAVAACETKVKTVLGIALTVGGNPLLRYFDARCKTVIGRSLREDDEALWCRLTCLNSTRNHVAHRGSELTIPEAEGHLATASEVFGWLDSSS
jgi:hypothetical protein